MLQLIAHLIGDYCLQNHWMATQKTSRWWPALVHVAFYGLPFLVLCDASPAAWAVIVSTHAVIDRYRLASRWCHLWGVGCEGVVMREVAAWRHFAQWGPEPWFGWKSWDARKAPEDAPPFLGVWLVIIVDNTAHLAINYAALRWL